MIDLVLESTAADNVHWQLTDVTNITLGSVNLTLSNKYLNEIVHWFDSEVYKVF